MSEHVHVDAHNWCALNFRTRKHEWYLGSEDPDGTIHLIPASQVPAIRLSESPGNTDVLERTRTPMEVLRDYFPDAKELKE